jgi:exodeoxyribonuclease V alpha subunit
LRPAGEGAVWLAEKLLEVPVPLIETAISLELDEGGIVQDTVEGTGCIFLTGLYQAEKAIGERLSNLAAGKPPWPVIDAGKAIVWLSAKSGLVFAESQKQAIELALSSKVLVITGGPGTGKTTVVNAILRILRANEVEMRLCAPTGRAAKRMSEATGQEAKTIHRLLEVDPKAGGFLKGENNPLECDLLIVDEASMIDIPLMHALLKAVPAHAGLLVVGDIDQLPSVGPGQVLADLIGSGAVPVIRLTEVFRQAAQSRIVTMAHRINKGELPDFTKPEGDSDFYFVDRRARRSRRGDFEARA